MVKLIKELAAATAVEKTLPKKSEESEKVTRAELAALFEPELQSAPSDKTG